MSFPLIINPSSTQQLADTLTQMRERAQLRQRQRLENRMLEQQIVGAKMEQHRADQTLALDQQRLTDARKLAELQEMDRRADNVRQDAIFQATVQQRAIENRRAEVENKQKMLRDFLALFPAGTVIPPAMASAAMRGNRHLEGTPAPQGMDITAEVAQAMGRSRPGLQGSAIRTPVPGQSDRGVSFFPETVNYNAPSGGGGGRERSATESAVDAALDTSFDLMDQMEAAVAENENANAEPFVAAAAEGLRPIKFLGLGRLGELAAQGLRSDAQTRFRTASTLWPHIYAQFQAHTRNGPQYAAMIEHAMGQMSTTVDPEIRREKMQTIRNIINRVWVERHGTPPPAPGSRLMMQDRLGSQFGGGEPAPIINPRFAPPQP